MTVECNFCQNYNEDPIRFLDFAKFSDNRVDKVFRYGISTKPLYPTVNHDKIIYLDLETPIPCHCPVQHYIHYCGKSLNLCPYTSNWVNEMLGYKKCEAIFFPFNSEYIPTRQDKIYDVIYTGQIHGKELYKLLEPIKQFNYCHIGYNSGNFKNVSYNEKLNKISQTKISIIHNLLWLDDHWINTIESLPNFQANVAYKDAAKYRMYPQLKSRVFEAAFCHSLMLVKEDPWNVIENWFNPNEHFIYFNNEEDLTDKIQHIITYFPSYDKITENAFKHANSHYTTNHFWERFIK